MRLTEVAPCAALAPFVRTFEVVESDVEVERTLLPDPCVIVALRYAGSAALVEQGEARPVPGCAVTGLRTSARRMRTAAESGVVLAKFRVLGARCFFTEPLHRLFGVVAPLNRYMDANAVARASAAIVEATSTAERAAIFERFLLAHFIERRPDALLEAAVAAITRAPGSVRVAELAGELGLSQDAFEKRFRRSVGAAPKAFATVVHFRRAVEAFPHLRASLTELALAAGFYDQSHFIRRFRALAGAAPGRVLGSPDYC